MSIDIYIYIYMHLYICIQHLNYMHEYVISCSELAEGRIPLMAAKYASMTR